MILIRQSVLILFALSFLCAGSGLALAQSTKQEYVTGGSQGSNPYGGSLIQSPYGPTSGTKSGTTSGTTSKTTSKTQQTATSPSRPATKSSLGTNTSTPKKP